MTDSPLHIGGDVAVTATSGAQLNAMVGNDNVVEAALDLLFVNAQYKEEKKKKGEEKAKESAKKPTKGQQDAKKKAEAKKTAETGKKTETETKGYGASGVGRRPHPHGEQGLDVRQGGDRLHRRVAGRRSASAARSPSPRRTLQGSTRTASSCRTSSRRTRSRAWSRS